VTLCSAQMQHDCKRLCAALSAGCNKKMVLCGGCSGLRQLWLLWGNFQHLYCCTAVLLHWVHRRAVYCSSTVLPFFNEVLRRLQLQPPASAVLYWPEVLAALQMAILAYVSCTACT
jgi:hypothetical protein